MFGRGPVDLLIEEAAVNDSTNGFAAREPLRGMEGIVRHARQLNPKIDILLLHFVDPGKMASYRAGRTPEVIVAHEQVAAHYGLPSIELAREVTERIDAKEFTWEKDFKDLHPSPFGQTVYTRSIVRLLEAAWREPASAVARDYGLPPALDEKSYFRGRLVDVREARCENGWTVDPAWKPGDGIATRPGFVNVPMLVTTTPGAVCSLRFEGTAIGVFAVSGPDAGAIEFSMDGAPFAGRDLKTQWSARLHLPWASVLDADLAQGSHELRFRLNGQALRIVHFLVN